MVSHTEFQLLLFLTLVVINVLSFQHGKVHDIRGIPSYRSVRLSWRFVGDDARQLQGFFVHYTELGTWKPRIHKLGLYLNGGNSNAAHLIEDGDGSYNAVIYRLRAATPYKFSISPILRSNTQFVPDNGVSIQSQWIQITTLPFSARVTHCAKNKAIVEVKTGRQFYGKIGVKNVYKKECETIGTGSNMIDSTTFTIDFEKCGAVKNGSSVLSTIIVQENAIVMTGPDRQFIVNCSYAPAFLVVSAAVNMPVGANNEGLGENSISNTISDDVFTYEKYKGGNLRQSRILADHSSETSSDTMYEQLSKKAKGLTAGQIVVITFFVLASMLGIFGGLYWITLHVKRLGQKTTELPDGDPQPENSSVISLKSSTSSDQSSIAPVMYQTSDQVSLVSVKDISEA